MLPPSLSALAIQATTCLAGLAHGRSVRVQDLLVADGAPPASRMAAWFEPGLLSAIVLCTVVLIVLNVVLWLVSRAVGRVTVVDPFWGLGFVLMMWAMVLWLPPTGPRGWLATVLASAWGIRYAYHLYTRPWGHDEANQYYPYAKMREKHGAAFALRSLWIVFLPQAAGNLVIGMPLLVAFTASAQQLDLLAFLGVALVLGGVFFEGLADAQLAAHKRDPSKRGTVLDTGLWSMCRHPNYFGDSLLWWGLWLIAAGGGGAWTVFSPLLITVLLAKVTGVPMVERHSKIAQTAAYAQYAAKTPGFVPNPLLYRAGGK